jgi:hypothetical protein
MDWKEWRCKSAMFQAFLERVAAEYRGADLRSIVRDKGKTWKKAKTLQENQSNLIISYPLNQSNQSNFITLKSYPPFYQLHSLENPNPGKVPPFEFWHRHFARICLFRLSAIL